MNKNWQNPDKYMLRMLLGPVKFHVLEKVVNGGGSVIKVFKYHTQKVLESKY